MSTLSFQPEADRYYAEGYWREGDLWEEFAARADEAPDKVGVRSSPTARSPTTSCARAAIALSGRLAALSAAAGRRGDPDRPPLRRRGRRAARVPAPRAGRRAAAADVQRRAALGAGRPDAAPEGVVAFGGDARAREGRARGGRGRLRARDRRAGAATSCSPSRRRPERRARAADDIAMVLHSSGTTSTPKGIVHSSNTLRYATEGVARRWELSGDDMSLVVCEFGFVGAFVFGYFPVLLLGGTGVLMTRWDAEEALRLVERHRCTFMLLMPTHGADTLQAVQASERDLSSMRVLAAPGLTPERRVAMRDAFGVAPLADYGLSEVPGHAAHGLREAEAKMVKTEGRPYDGTEIRILGPDGAAGARGRGGRRRRQRAEPVPGLPGQRRAHARVADRVGRLPHRRPRLPRRGRPPGLRRAQQGHHPARRRDRRPGRDRARADAPSRHPRGGDRAAAGRAARRAGVRGPRARARQRRRRRSRTCRSSSTRRAWRSTAGPSRSRSSTTSRARRR